MLNTIHSRKRRVETLLRSKDGEFAMRPWLLITSEATLIKSHQHDCLNMSQMTLTIDRLVWTRGAT